MPILKGNVVQNYIWVADYGSGICMCEFEKNRFDDSMVEHSFYSINKESVERLYLTGPAMQLGFNTKSGKFFVIKASGASSELEIKLGSTLITRPSHDLIQHKTACSLFSPGGGQAGSLIESCNVGYKWTDGNKSAKIIAHIGNHNDLAFLSVRLSWDQDFEGLLMLNGQGSPVSLKKGKAEEFSVIINEGKKEITR